MTDQSIEKPEQQCCWLLLFQLVVREQRCDNDLPLAGKSKVKFGGGIYREIDRDVSRFFPLIFPTLRVRLFSLVEYNADRLTQLAQNADDQVNINSVTVY